MPSFSPMYDAALDAARKHHGRSKTYSGKLMRPHWEYIGELIARLECRTVLDYGSGKGLQYEWVNPRNGQTLEQGWGVSVVKYDPAYPPFAAEPQGKFDLVLCTHVLGSIPVVDHPLFIDRLHRFATKAIFVAERVAPVKKTVFRDIPGMPRGWRRNDWAKALARPASSIETILSTVTVTDRGDICERGKV